jgi:hypothetical protein
VMSIGRMLEETIQKAIRAIDDQDSSRTSMRPGARESNGHMDLRDLDCILSWLFGRQDLADDQHRQVVPDQAGEHLQHGETTFVCSPASFLRLVLMLC